jgi:hypothetical protein
MWYFIGFVIGTIVVMAFVVRFKSKTKKPNFVGSVHVPPAANTAQVQE